MSRRFTEREDQRIVEMADARNDVPAIAAVLCPAYRGIGGRLLCHFYPLPGRKVLGFSDCASRVLWGAHAAARVHHASRQRGGCVASYVTRATARADATA